MAMLESYTVKPEGIYPMTIKALDNNHLGLILKDMFTKGPWKDLDATAPVEIIPPDGHTLTPPVKEFRA